MSDSLIDSRQLRAFVEIARSGSFTKAARLLHLSQSAISHSIRALESDLGCALLERRGKLIALTQAGEWFLQRAKVILAEMQGIRDDLVKMESWGHGRIRLGASSTATQFVLPRAIMAVRQQHPGCTICVTTCDTEQAFTALRAGSIDLALAMRPPSDELDLEYRDLFREDLAFLVPPDHPWKDSGFDSSSLKFQSFISYTARSFLMRMVSNHLRRCRLQLPPSQIELGSFQAILELVKGGQGVTVMATWIARAEIETGSVLAVPLPGSIPRRQWIAAMKRGYRTHIAEEVLLQNCVASIRVPTRLV